MIGPSSSSAVTQCAVAPMSLTQVVQAVPVLADHQQHARPFGEVVELHVHAELLPRMLEQCSQRVLAGQLRRRLKMHTHEKKASGVFAFEVPKLLRVDDVAAGLVKQTRNRVHDALGVGAGEREYKLMFERLERHHRDCRDRA